MAEMKIVVVNIAPVGSVSELRGLTCGGEIVSGIKRRKRMSEVG